MNQNKQNPFAQNPEHIKLAGGFSRAVERILAPLCRLLLERGIGLRSAKEALSRAYLKAAADLAASKGAPVTVGRLALFTGLPRGDVERLRREVQTNVETSEPVFAAVSRVLTSWHEDRKYTQPIVGLPRELPIEDKRGESFVGLVQECAPQLDPHQLLEELVRTGHVSLVPDSNKVHVMTRAYIPEPFAQADSERFGRMVENYLNTLRVNAEKPGPGLGHLDRHVSADYALSPADEARFHALVREKAAKETNELDGFLRTCQPAPENGRRVGMVMFYFVDTASSDGSANSEKASEAPQGNEADVTDVRDSDVIDTLSFERTRGK